jgi:simple sugar transport system permease protein
MMKNLVITLAAALASTLLLLALFASNLAEATIGFFATPLSNVYFLGNLIATAGPLIVAGLGTAVAFSSKNFNLGGEGQIYAGALAATLVGLAIPGTQNPGTIPILALRLSAFGAAMVSGGLLGGFSGMLKRRLGVDELISSFLVSSGVVLVVDFLVTGPFQDGSSNFQTTKAIAPFLMFPRILPPSSLSSGILLALVAALAGKAVMDRTRFGFELRLCGIDREFARYVGIDNGFYTTLPMAISGALHGMAGALMVFGSYRATMRGFSAGSGWNAIAVSLIAGNNPLFLIPSALFYSYLEAGSKSILMAGLVRSEIASVVQSVIFLLITATRAPKIFFRRSGPRKSP